MTDRWSLPVAGWLFACLTLAYLPDIGHGFIAEEILLPHHQIHGRGWLRLQRSLELQRTKRGSHRVLGNTLLGGRHHGSGLGRGLRQSAGLQMQKKP